MTYYERFTKALHSLNEIAKSDKEYYTLNDLKKMGLGFIRYAVPCSSKEITVKCYVPRQSYVNNISESYLKDFEQCYELVRSPWSALTKIYRLKKEYLYLPTFELPFYEMKVKCYQYRKEEILYITH